jgi:DNA-binding Lrp family transcriptional regulator
MGNNLDILDKKILYELDLDSRIPIIQLARKVNASKETVNFRIKRLVKNDYIKGFITTVYTSHLNRFYFKIFYKFRKTTPDVDRQIIEFIQNYRKTAWFGTFEGPYDLAFLIIAKSIYDLDALLTEFRNLFGQYILEQEIHIMTEVHRFNLKFFYQGKKDLHTKYPKELKESQIDHVDHEIIKNMANNSRVSVLELAKALKVDPGTIIYRIKKLKEQKILGTNVLAVNFERFDQLHFQIDFKLINHEAVNKLVNYFAANKNATFATVTRGKYDLAIELVVKDNKELKSILDQLKEKFFQEILDYDTFLITKEYNVNWFPD